MRHVRACTVGELRRGAIDRRIGHHLDQDVHALFQKGDAEVRVGPVRRGHHRRVEPRIDGDARLAYQQIVHLFEEQGIQIARRTVAKYRDQLGILPARMRKRV